MTFALFHSYYTTRQEIVNLIPTHFQVKRQENIGKANICSLILWSLPVSCFAKKSNRRQHSGNSILLGRRILLSNTGENIYERRDGRWEGRYICGRKPDGRAQYVSVYGRSCADVRNKIRERLRACTPEPAPRSAGTSVLTVNQLFESFLSHADVKPSTYARYKTVIDLHILPKLGKRRVAGLTAKELSGYLAEKRRCGNLRTGGPLSEKSVRDLAVLLKSALRFAQKEFHIYTDALNMPLPSYKQKRVRVFSDQEVQRMAKEIQDVPNQKNTGILLALCAGMRIGEICALKVSDIDFLAGTIDISRAVQRIQTGKKTELLVQTPKSNASERVIPLTSDLLCYLKTAVRGLPEQAYILTGRADKPMEPRTLRYYFSGVLKRCNIRYRNFHVLRHTFATRCIETGMDVKSLSELLGHADVRTTLKLYVHPSLESKRRAIQKIALLDICS